MRIENEKAASGIYRTDSFSFSYEGGDSELFYYLKSMIPENCEHFVYSF